jgi:DNA-binding HxlR family transcriptional regulator
MVPARSTAGAPGELAFRKWSAHTKVVDASKTPRSHCPVSLALEAIGDRWSLLILRDIIMRGKRRYQEFLNSEEGISTNILAERLARLEKQGLISKAGDPADKRQFRYLPTRKALDLLPVIFEMARWSFKYNPDVNPDQPFAQRMRAGEKAFMRQIRSQFETPRGRNGAGRRLRAKTS